MDEKENKVSLMKKIMEYKFYLNDLNLYLDTHNNDKRALALHNDYVQKLDDAVEEYEKKYGPLTVDTIMKSWDWAKNLWPWQRGWNN